MLPDGAGEGGAADPSLGLLIGSTGPADTGLEDWVPSDIPY